jgi:hypothetical protein
MLAYTSDITEGQSCSMGPMTSFVPPVRALSVSPAARFHSNYMGVPQRIPALPDTCRRRVISQHVILDLFQVWHVANVCIFTMFLHYRDDDAAYGVLSPCSFIFQ